MKPLTKNLTAYFLLIALLFGCAEQPKELADDRPRRIELLFLGHESEHHNSRAYMPILAAALTKSGINLTYTEQVSDLNAKTLSDYDGLIVYANHETISVEQEKALLEYVADGHAFIPLHSASFCFKNSPEYIALVGAQFKEHGTGTFAAEIVDKAHPVTDSLESFSTWDETYVHHLIEDDIHVLMERVEGDHREPWTWVKNYGEGKVFYTAYGHDERTWNHPGFQELVKNGILWAVQPHVFQNWEAFAKDIPTLQYETRDNIPNYEQRDPPLGYQLPLSPEASAKLMQVPPGFDLALFASEPDIINPIAMEWDEKGRLWVIETVDYPNTVRDDKGTGDDRIKICEDTDGDGKADTFTVFAEGLNIPTSFAFVNGGILVSQAPQFLFLKDTDGDDVADVRETVIEGWGTFDTHAGPSNLQIGLDNQIYGVVGYSGFEGSIFGKPEKFRQGLYRFNSDFDDFEFLTNTSNNTWGLGFTESNAIFASTANNTHSVFMGLPNRTLREVRGISESGNRKIDGHYAMLSITPNIRQVDVFGGFTAAAGHSFYTAREFPEAYWNRIAFVCEPTGGVVHQAILEKEGAGYREKDGGNLLASSDEWVSPVDAKVGPDGAVWVLDWYNFIVQHNPTPTAERGGYNAETGSGNAHVNPLRDREHGRIWRVYPRTLEPEDLQSLDRDDTDALIDALSHDNLFWRKTAQRLLIEKKDPEVLSDLLELAESADADATGIAHGALHALWTLDGLGLLPENEEAVNGVRKALTHSSAAVRKAAIQLLDRATWSDEALLSSGILSDPDPEVQLAALIEVIDRPASGALGSAIYDLSKDDGVKGDFWLSKAAYAAGVKHRDGFLAAFRSEHPDFRIEAPIPVERQLQDHDDSHWGTVELPTYNEAAGIDMNGLIWYRKEVTLTAAEARGRATLSLGPINDGDVTYVNGQKVGGYSDDRDTERRYPIPSGLLKAGANTIAVQLQDDGGWGGIYGKPELLFLQTAGNKHSLAGTWKYEIEKNTDLSEVNVFEGTTIAAVLAAEYMDPSDPGLMGDLDGMADAVKIHIKTIPNEMKYDVTSFEVAAGQAVELTLENVDFMQHNLIIVQRGAKEKVGAAADKLAVDPRGAELEYVPQLPEVLFATGLVDPEGKAVLTFRAPNEPGVYPFICTFPGHWRIMQGTMTVTPAAS